MSFIVKVANIFRILTRRPILHEEEGFYPWTSEDPVRVTKDGGFGINLDNPEVSNNVMRNMYICSKLGIKLSTRIVNGSVTNEDREYISKVTKDANKRFPKQKQITKDF